jgi:hypothetical protein
VPQDVFAQNQAIGFRAMVTADQEGIAGARDDAMRALINSEL